MNERLLRTLNICGQASVIYGIAQSFGLDFFTWEGREGGIQSFFGNQNLASAFFAIFGISLFGKIVNSSKHNKEFFSSLIWLILCFISIYQTDSQQGFIMLFLGAWLILFSKVFSKSLLAKFSFVFLSCASFLLLVLDIGRRLPWDSFFYTWTLDQRLSYIKASGQIINTFPVFGSGFGSLENLYKQFRPLESISLPGVDAYTDTSHSIALDLALGGGIVLLVLYLILLVTLIRNSFIVIRNPNGKEPLVIIVALLLALSFHLNIAQGSIVMYFWSIILSAIVLSQTNKNQKIVSKLSVDSNSRIQNRSHKHSEYSDTQFLVSLIGFALGSAMILPMLIVDSKVATNIISGNVEALVNLAGSFPSHSSRCAFISETLSVNGRNSESLFVSQLCVSQNENQLSSWKLIALNPTVDQVTKDRAIEKWKLLDPLQPPLR